MEFNNKILLVLLIGVLLALYPASYICAAPKRQKVIDFEDEVVEGMNKRPLDSLIHISEAKERKKKPHLYRKRIGFKTETTELLRALRFTP